MVEKRYTMGRFSHENGVVMPDLKTVYFGDDGTNTVLFKFVADEAGDLSAGTLYAAKATQNDDESFGLEWIELGKGNDDDIAEAIATMQLPAVSDLSVRLYSMCSEAPWANPRCLDYLSTDDGSSIQPEDQQGHVVELGHDAMVGKHGIDDSIAQRLGAQVQVACHGFDQPGTTEGPAVLVDGVGHAIGVEDERCGGGKTMSWISNRGSVDDAERHRAASRSRRHQLRSGPEQRVLVAGADGVQTACAQVQLAIEQRDKHVVHVALAQMLVDAAHNSFRRGVLAGLGAQQA